MCLRVRFRVPWGITRSAKVERPRFFRHGRKLEEDNGTTAFPSWVLILLGFVGAWLQNHWAFWKKRFHNPWLLLGAKCFTKACSRCVAEEQLRGLVSQRLRTIIVSNWRALSDEQVPWASKDQKGRLGKRKREIHWSRRAYVTPGP